MGTAHNIFCLWYNFIENLEKRKVHMGKVGFTTTIPVEVIFAAGRVPVDLNNIFITHPHPDALLAKAERKGFPRSSCAWIKGIFSSLLELKDIECIVGVIEGDCSNTRALLEVLEIEGVKHIPFSYPSPKDPGRLKKEIDRLMEFFGVDYRRVMEVKQRLDRIRRKATRLDRLTYEHNKVTGFENHLWQVSCSDFDGDYRNFEERLDSFIREAEGRQELPQRIRIGYIGVPPIFPDIYSFIEECGARVVFNEVQRQFTLAPAGLGKDIYTAYMEFTYPYTLEDRLKDIKGEIEKRNIHGVIHYTQAFCFRGIEDIVIKEKLKVPVLTVEGDRPGELDARTKLRIESFIEMLKDME